MSEYYDVHLDDLVLSPGAKALPISMVVSCCEKGKASHRSRCACLTDPPPRFDDVSSLSALALGLQGLLAAFTCCTYSVHGTPCWRGRAKLVDNSLPARSCASAALQVSLALDAARGLQALHEAPGGPIVHYDIKPQQMMLDENGRVKINDLNTCQFVDADVNGNSCPFAMSAVGVGGYFLTTELRFGVLEANVDNGASDRQCSRK